MKNNISKLTPLLFLYFCISYYNIWACDPCGTKTASANSEPGISIMLLGIGGIYQDTTLGDVALREDDYDITKLSSPESVVGFIDERYYKKYSDSGLIKTSTKLLGGRFIFGADGFIETPSIKIFAKKIDDDLPLNSKGYALFGYAGFAYENKKNNPENSSEKKLKMLYEIKVYGGYKKDLDAENFISPRNVSDGDFYIVEVERTDFYGVPTKTKYRVYQIFEAHSKPKDNIWHYDLNGEKASCKKELSKVRVKNNGAEDTEFDLIKRTLLRGNKLRTWEVVRYEHYKRNFLTDENGKVKPDKNGNWVVFDKSNPRKADMKLYDKMEIISEDGSLRKISEERQQQYMGQGAYESKYSGVTHAKMDKKGKWTISEIDPVKGVKIGRIYKPVNSSDVKDINSDGIITVEDLEGSDVELEEFEYDGDGVTLISKNVSKGRLINDGRADLKSKKQKYSYVLNDSAKKISKKNYRRIKDSAGKMRISEESLVLDEVSNELVAVTSVQSTTTSSPASEDIWKRAVIKTDTFKMKLETEEFILADGLPNYGNVPLIAPSNSQNDWMDLSLEYKVFGVLSGNSTDAKLPWNNYTSAFSGCDLVPNKSILQVDMTDISSNLVYQARYVYAPDSSSDFKLISWSYYVYGEENMLLGTYRSDGSYEVSTYSDINSGYAKVRIRRKADNYGMIVETGFSLTSEVYTAGDGSYIRFDKLAQELFTRTIGVSSEYGDFKDRITTQSGSMSDFNRCGCSSIVGNNGDGLVNYYISDTIGGSGENVSSDTLLYQTYRYNNGDGKPETVIDSYGIVTRYTNFTNNGNETATEVPPGFGGGEIYKRSTYNEDGSIKSITGVGVVNEYHRIDDGNDVKTVTVNYGRSNSPKFSTKTYRKHYEDGVELEELTSEEDHKGITRYTNVKCLEIYKEQMHYVDTGSGVIYRDTFSSGVYKVSEALHPDGTKTVYNYALDGESLGWYGLVYNPQSQTYTRGHTFNTISKEYVFEDGIIWLVTTTDASGEVLVNKRRLNFLPSCVEDGYVIAEHSMDIKDNLKSEYKVLVDKTSKKRISKTINYALTQGVWRMKNVKEETYINDILVKESFKVADSQSGVVRTTKDTTHSYDNYGRVVESSTKDVDGNILYSIKNFYQPAHQTNVGLHYAIKSQGRLEAVSVYNGTEVMGRMGVYYSDDEKNAGKLKGLGFATSFDSNKKPTSANWTYCNYNNMGLVNALWGYEEVPTLFEYNEYGLMTDMYLFKLASSEVGLFATPSWPSSITKADINAERTKWEYDAFGEMVLKKTDALERSEHISRDVKGRPEIVSFANQDSYWISYDAKGNISSQIYEGLEALTGFNYEYDDKSRITHVSSFGDGMAGNIRYEYSNLESKIPSKETYANAWVLEREINEQGKVLSVELRDSAGAIKYQVGYVYDGQDKLQSLNANGKTISYTRDAMNSITGITLNSLAKIIYTYDNLHRLKSMSYNAGSNELRKNEYSFDLVGKVAAVGVYKDGALYGQWRYTYSQIGQGLLSAGLYKSENGDELHDSHSIYQYAYDMAGNPYSKSVGGGEVSYTSNKCNQTFEINKSAESTYAIRGEAHKDAVLRHSYGGTNWEVLSRPTGETKYFYTVPAYATAPQYKTLKIEATLANAGANGADAKTLKLGKLYLEETPEILTYDVNGNLLSDSRWDYKWSLHQRLLEVETSSDAISAGAPQEKYVYAYDHKGRKVSATKYTYKNNDWQLNYINTRYYDDHNIIYETTYYYKLSENNQLSLEITKTNKYYYGEDLLGGLYGTGGTGGLRMLEIDGIEAYAFESMNGNIEALYSVAMSENESIPETEVLPKLLADYEYEPFGQLRKQNGLLSESNPLRFSTRYTEPNTNLRYYIYRHYSPKLSKWLSKDPIAEDGGRNLYQMVINDSINYVDILGLSAKCECELGQRQLVEIPDFTLKLDNKKEATIKAGTEAINAIGYLPTLGGGAAGNVIKVTKTMAGILGMFSEDGEKYPIPTLRELGTLHNPYTITVYAKYKKCEAIGEDLVWSKNATTAHKSQRYSHYSYHEGASYTLDEIHVSVRKLQTALLKELGLVK